MSYGNPFRASSLIAAKRKSSGRSTSTRSPKRRTTSSAIIPSSSAVSAAKKRIEQKKKTGGKKTGMPLIMPSTRLQRPKNDALNKARERRKKLAAAKAREAAQKQAAIQSSGRGRPIIGGMINQGGAFEKRSGGRPSRSGRPSSGMTTKPAGGGFVMSAAAIAANKAKKLAAQKAKEQQAAAEKANAGRIALIEQHKKDQKTKSGMQLSKPTSPLPKVLEAVASTTVTMTPNPKTLNETVVKMVETGSVVAPPKVIRETLPVIVREIQKGTASPLQAAAALKGHSAKVYADCKDQLKMASSKDAQLIRKLLSQPTPVRGARMKQNQFPIALNLFRTEIERAANIQKQGEILLAQNKADAFQKTQSDLQSLIADLAKREADLYTMASATTAQMADPSLVKCLIEATKAEGRLVFEAKFGEPDLKPPAEIQVVEEMLPEEEAVALVETAEILQQAAEEGVGHEEAIIAPTPEDKAMEAVEQAKAQVAAETEELKEEIDNLEKYLTPQNLLIAGLALGVAYTILNKD